MVLKITKQDCDLACELLNKAKREGDNTWLQPLLAKTDELRESVGALSHFVMCNVQTFTQVAMAMAPSHAKERSIPLPIAIAELQTQLVVRLIMYVVNRVVEAKQFESIMMFDDLNESSESSE